MIKRQMRTRLFMGSGKPPTATVYTGGEKLIEKVVNENSFPNIKECARYLHKIEPRRSVDGWRSKLYRFQGENDRDLVKEWASKSIEDDTSSYRAVYYDEHTDTYISVAPDTKMLVVIDGDTHRAMKKAYSSDGSNLSLDQMSREFGYPSSFIAKYMKVNGWSHNMDIYTNEEVLSKTVEQLVDETVASKRNQVMEKATKSYWKSIEKDADKYKLLQETVLGEFKELLQDKAKPAKPIKLDKAVRDYAVVLSPTDLHYGKHGWKDEVGEEYDLEIARERLLLGTQDLINRLPDAPEKIVVATGSDWFHVDNEVGQTTKGTPQDMAASPARILMDGCKLAREHIDLLRGVAPVEVIFMRGNHDRHSALFLMLYLDAAYEDCDDVTVIADPKLRQYMTYGNNLLGFTHGDGVRGVDLPSVMATEMRQAWGDTETHLWFHGHLHHEKMTETGGTQIFQLPSLAGHDRWHYRKGYTQARAGIKAHLVDKELGVVGSLFSPVMHE
tara:strand:+ start:667 stop:2166 length:1500 start_codon:yes stop_codon:yes gene_type:complete